MNELIVDADGAVTVVGDSGSVSGILAKRVKAATTPAQHDADGVETVAEVVPDADTLAVEVTSDELKVHAWRLPKVRTERLQQLRGLRNAKLDLIDIEIDKASKNQPGHTRTVDGSETEKQTLRDLPESVVDVLASLTNTDDMDDYLPTELA